MVDTGEEGHAFFLDGSLQGGDGGGEVVTAVDGQRCVLCEGGSGKHGQGEEEAADEIHGRVPVIGMGVKSVT